MEGVVRTDADGGVNAGLAVGVKSGSEGRSRVAM
jgi:hypothetical protein